MFGASPSKSAEFPVMEVAATGAGATISNTKGAFPLTEVTVTSEVKAGQFGVVETNVKTVGGFNGSRVMAFVTNVQLLASLMVMAYVPSVRLLNVSAPAPLTKLIPSILYS